MAFAELISDRAKISISFPGWIAALEAAPLDGVRRAGFRREIGAFLAFCRRGHAAVNVRVARGYLASLPEGVRREGARLALRWFVVEGRRNPGTPAVRRAEAGPAALDLGGTEWERDLVTALRRKGMLCRTEETYRRWARRLAEFIAPRSPYAATGDDVAAFLSQLAVAQRASASTHWQALNALVFFLQEGLHRTVGELAFKRARERRRIPMVLSREECACRLTE